MTIEGINEDEQISVKWPDESHRRPLRQIQLMQLMQNILVLRFLVNALFDYRRDAIGASGRCLKLAIIYGERRVRRLITNLRCLLQLRHLLRGIDENIVHKVLHQQHRFGTALTVFGHVTGRIFELYLQIIKTDPLDNLTSSINQYIHLVLTFVFK